MCSRHIKDSIPLPTSMDALLLFTTTVWLCMVNVNTENLEFWQIGVKLCESKCQQRNLCLGITYEMKYLHCQLLLKEAKEDKTNPGITLRYLNKGQILNMTACGKAVRILSSRFAERKCVEDETSGLKIEKNCVGPNPNCRNLVFQFLKNVTVDLPAFRQLVADGCYFSCHHTYGRNILHRAVELCTPNRSGCLKFVKFIVSKKFVSIDSKSTIGETALMFAARGGHVDIMKFLVGEHCNVSITTRHGHTILHIAVLVNKLNVVKYILKNDLIAVVADVKGKTPLDLARKLGRTKMKKLLMSKQIAI